jgi:hypothetical protein
MRWTKCTYLDSPGVTWPIDPAACEHARAWLEMTASQRLRYVGEELTRARQRGAVKPLAFLLAVRDGLTSNNM